MTHADNRPVRDDLRPKRAVHDEQADAFTDLGSRKPYALGLLEREELSSINFLTSG